MEMGRVLYGKWEIQGFRTPIRNNAGQGSTQPFNKTNSTENKIYKQIFFISIIFIYIKKKVT